MAAAAESDLEVFKKEIQPVLEEYCYNCHGDGNKKGGVQLDGFETETALHDHKLWMRALKNVRSGIMPPAEEPGLPPELVQKVTEWIKREAFSLDPQNPDPGRVTVRRLNRVDYRNTIRDLTGVDYDTQREFPADDTGNGFDNIGDVLTISPMLLEKYLDAAQSIVASAVPTKSKAVAETVIEGRTFAAVKPAVVPTPASTLMAAETIKPANEMPPGAPAIVFKRPAPEIAGTGLDLSYYTPATVTATHQAPYAGKYQLHLDLRAVERYVEDQFDYNRCQVLFKVDGQTLLDREFVRQGEATFKYIYERYWTEGANELSLEVNTL